MLLLGLENDLSKRPKELSGGMQQRVAFARAIAYDPDILLLDEAFGSQDYGKKEIMYDMIIARAETKIIINVTHNEQEACALGGRIVNMRPIV